jgi:hypothetical protein
MGAAAGRLGGTAGSAAAAAGLPPPDGLIPLGSLPSGRFGLGSSTESSKSRDCSAADGASYAGAREQWRLVAAQQQEVEGAVAAHMRSYARHRARLEEEINRKQEAGAQLAAVQQLDGCATPGSKPLQGQQGVGTRVLLHVDSQHQPSQVATAYTGLAGGAGLVQRLAPLDKVKEAKQQLLQVRAARGWVPCCVEAGLVVVGACRCSLQEHASDRGTAETQLYLLTV